MNIDDDEIEEFKPHPYGVRPNGNYYFDSLNIDFCDTRKLGLGYFSVLDDHLILQEIFEYFNEYELTKVINRISKAFYILVQEEEQWKMRTIEKFRDDKDFRFKHNWQFTFKFNSNRGFSVIPEPIHLRYYYSDYLFHIWRCTSIDLKRFENGDSIDRRSNLSFEEFRDEYLIPNRPVIITDGMKNWNAKQWTRESFIEKCGKVPLYINAGIFMTADRFLDYSKEYQEEMPMYLFDHYYGERIPEILNDYSPLETYFKDDFFEVLGESRPSFRWLLAGPERSGASFHLDPNHTSAFNAVVTGRKKWVMYPPHVTPPGVSPSNDGLEVTAPSSIIEWFINFYEQPTNESKKTKNKKNLINRKSNSKKQPEYDLENDTYENVKPLEGILHAGELIFVPSGWWHSVLNLEESIAITHNFVDRYNLLRVIEFLKTKKKKDLYHEFTTKFESKYPGLIQQLEAEQDERIQKKQESQKHFKKTSLWETVTSSNTPSTLNNPTTTNTNSFSFSFSFSTNDELETQ
ncbi:transcription factor jumonji [Tieghemostelium lacteum]|uniref:Transcription factor jumonji n=1 Tax=Tieghemostelium lacteum TaxID=361077 RepID=A0A151Z5N5_TIELA|nr:transcription factor jumonji [Tieghemostelium lacteum]|eukprot:KYQ89272.1 transcription factor jumonji [Tieghemostelium lacteum]